MFTDRLDMTIAVDWDVKPQTKQTLNKLGGSLLQLTKTINWPISLIYSKTGLKQPLKKNTKNWFSIQRSLNAGQKYCRMLQGEHSAILSTSIKDICY